MSDEVKFSRKGHTVTAVFPDGEMIVSDTVEANLLVEIYKALAETADAAREAASNSSTQARIALRYGRRR